MNSKIYKIKTKTVTIILIFAFLGMPFLVQGADALVYANKEFVLDTAARIIANTILGMLGNQVSEVIRTKGREGGDPLFVTDWREFVVKSGQRGEDIFRSEMAYALRNNIICPGARDSMSQIFNTNKSSVLDIGQLITKLRTDIDPFQTKVKCSIPDNVYKDFQEDFQKGGGWDTWSRMVTGSNNIYGLLSESMNELNTQKAVEQKSDESETRSSGFLGKRQDCSFQNEKSSCQFFGNIVTPANILGNSASKTIDSQFDWLTSSDEVSEVIVALVGTAFSRLENFMTAKASGLIGPGDLTQRQELGANIEATQKQCLQGVEDSCKKISEDQCKNTTEIIDECKLDKFNACMSSDKIKKDKLSCENLSN